MRGADKTVSVALAAAVSSSCTLNAHVSVAELVETKQYWLKVHRSTV